MEERLSVVEQMTLELLYEARRRERTPFRQSDLLEAFEPLLPPGVVRKALKRLIAIGAIRETSERPLAYAVNVANSDDLLEAPLSRLAGEVYQCVVRLHPEHMYVDRDLLDTTFATAYGLASDEVGRALESLVTEKLLTRASFTEERYFPSFTDADKERLLAETLAGVRERLIRDVVWSVEVFGVGPTTAPGHRGRLSPLAA